MQHLRAGGDVVQADHIHAHSDLSDHSTETHHHASSAKFTPTGSIAATNVQTAIVEHDADTTLHPGAGAPTAADYLVGTAQAGLSAEIVVGTTPGGELGGTWPAPTVDATHSGSSHAGVVTTHEGAADPHTGYQKESEKGAASGYASLDGSTKVPIAQVPTGSTSTTVPLGDHTHASSGGELLMQDGVSSPPVPLENEAGTDWLYAG